MRCWMLPSAGCHAACRQCQWAQRGPSQWRPWWRQCGAQSGHGSAPASARLVGARAGRSGEVVRLVAQRGAAGGRWRRQPPHVYGHAAPRRATAHACTPRPAGVCAAAGQPTATGTEDHRAHTAGPQPHANVHTRICATTAQGTPSPTRSMPMDPTETSLIGGATYRRPTPSPTDATTGPHHGRLATPDRPPRLSHMGPDDRGRNSTGRGGRKSGRK